MSVAPEVSVRGETVSDVLLRKPPLYPSELRDQRADNSNGQQNPTNSATTAPQPDRASGDGLGDGRGTKPQPDGTDNGNTRSLSAMTKIPTGPGVYFVGMLAGPDLPLIKIGCTANLAGRLVSLEATVGQPLTLLAWLSTSRAFDLDRHRLERTLHQHFGDSRANFRNHREWFHATPEVLALLSEMRRIGSPKKTLRHVRKLIGLEPRRAPRAPRFAEVRKATRVAASLVDGRPIFIPARAYLFCAVCRTRPDPVRFCACDIGDGSACGTPICLSCCEAIPDGHCARAVALAKWKPAPTEWVSP